MTRDGIDFPTKRDFCAFGELLKRTDLGLKEPDVVTIEPIVNADGDINCEHSWQDDDYDWHDCDALADIRVVRCHDYEQEWDSPAAPASPTDIYSDAYCLRCFQRELDQWLQDGLEMIATAVFDARERGADHQEREAPSD